MTDRDQLIIFVVGAAVQALPETFFISKILLCQHSAFYKMSLQGDWGESYKRCIELPKGNPRIFGSFIEYIKTGNTKMLWLTGANAENVQTARTDMHHIISLYGLADMCQVIPLKDQILDVFINLPVYSQAPLMFEHIEQIYQVTRPESKIRQWALDKWQRNGSQLSDEQEKQCPRFAIALEHAMNESGPSERIQMNDFTCAYHEHAGNIRCPLHQ